MSNPFWDYSLGAYGRKGVAQVCLELQDVHGLDVNMLLYAAWLAHTDRALRYTHLIELDAAVEEWREGVVKPIRTLRRQLQQAEGAGNLYAEMKSMELRAEQQQQAMMYAFSQRSVQLSYAPRPLQNNLTEVARHARPAGDEWAPSLGNLTALLSS